jgi:hypothetical protein
MDIIYDFILHQVKNIKERLVFFSFFFLSRKHFKGFEILGKK